MSKKMDVHFSSKSDNWATPQAFFDKMNEKYGPFDLDVCASHENHKVARYCTKEGLFEGFAKEPWLKYGTDGFKARWHVYGKCWMNPPYGREIAVWIAKASYEAAMGATVVCLLPARTDTKWFHTFCYNKANVTVEFLKGRLKFGNATNAAPFPSMVVVFKPGGGE
jgi:phage N-6-adenine-methyltransferase